MIQKNLTKIIQIAAYAVTLLSVRAQKIENIPRFVPDGIVPYHNMYFTGIFQGGDGEITPGELVTWRYPFKHEAKEINGERTEMLQQSSTMTYLLHNKTHIKVEINGMLASIQIPRNISTISSLFSFASVSLSEATMPIVLHRLGRPDRQSGQGEGNWFLYSRTVTMERTRYATAYGRATGEVQIDGAKKDVELDTVTNIPIEEKITFFPYCFKIHFDVNGKVIRVEDLVDRTATWVKK